MRAAARSVCHPLSPAVPQGGRDAEPRLGADGDLLSLSEGSLDPPAHHQSGRIAILSGAAKNRRRQALQEGRQRRGLDLEDPDDCGEEIPPPQLARTARGSLRWTTIRRRNASAGNYPEAPRRLISFTHLLR